ncbi:hypothetical protein BKA93DRAFT_230818 [Sparassis latifolia]
MQNLLRTLTASQLKSSLPETDLKLLLSAVKESRRQSSDVAKLGDAFYDSLEGLLLDLRTITPVRSRRVLASRLLTSHVQDNHDAEAFLKPVSKTDVPDYYDVIANPMDLQTMLRKVKQKQYKSKREFKDDLDLIWSNCFTYNATENHPLRMCARRLKVKAEKLLKNITDWKERADPVIPADISIRCVTPLLNGVTVNGHGPPYTPALMKSPSPAKQPSVVVTSRKARRDLPFQDSPAIVRTPAGMATFLSLDGDFTQEAGKPAIPNGVEYSTADLATRLGEYALLSDDEGESSGCKYPEVSLKTIEGEVGTKRKLNGYVDNRPRKRARTHTPVEKEVVELWWDAMQSDELLGNGLPTLAHASSEPIPSPSPLKPITDQPREATRRKKKRKKDELAQSSLLFHMNNNIRTLKRVRTTHAKFSALKQSTEEGNSLAVPPDLAVEDVEDVVDERPWRPVGSGIDIGEENADDCLHWMGSKVLEHAGFQGTSKAALDVLASVTSEYLLNVGRTIHFLCDKYADKMTSEEIILHTLFESGTTRINELERYINDDIIRYGGRLAELEKKLGNAYREATTEEAWDDDALFHNAEDEAEEGEFVMGNFADSFGEDFLGLRELGIAAEFGLSSLTIPKRLLKGKGNQGNKEGPSAAKPSEPPPPFPPPPPFVPFNSQMIDHQIGLLKPYYQQRFSSLSTAIAPSQSALPSQPLVPAPTVLPSAMLVLPDDAPTPSHAKVGPLGQILKAAPSGASKKKPKGKASGAPTNQASEADLSESLAPGVSAADSPKKTKSSASTSKKKSKPSESLPPVVMASA